MNEIQIDPAHYVACDFCSRDYTESDACGGVLAGGSYAVGPCCASRVQDRDVTRRCPPGVPFADWVREGLR